MKITKIEIIPFDQEYKGSMMFSSSNTKATGEFLLVKIHTDEGITGIGSSVGFTQTPALNAGSNRSIGMSILMELSTMLIGEDPRRVGYLIERIIDCTGGWGYENWFVMSYLDCALWDLKGKLLNVPVYDLLGGIQREKIPLEHIESFKQTPEEQAEEAQRYLDAGFHSIKLHVESDGKKALERFKRVRKILGDDVPIAADMACGYSVSSAVTTINAMNEYDLHFAEQPLHSYDTAGMLTLRSKTTVPLIADQAGRSIPEAYERIRLGAVDGCHCLICRVGGVYMAQKYADLLDAAYLDYQICNLGNSIANALAAHFAVSRKKAERFYDELGLYLYLHGAVDTDSIKEDVIVKPSGRIRNGFLYPPDGPGIGVELNEEYFASCVRDDIGTIVVQ